MQDEVNTKVVAIMIKGGKISAEVLKKALDKFIQEIEKAQKQMQPVSYTHLMRTAAFIRSTFTVCGRPLRKALFWMCSRTI